jgi:predicted N-acetyltransferase YhbS
MPSHSALGSGILDRAVLHDLRRHFDAGLLERFYDDVLRRYFPPDELDSLDVIAEGLTTDGDPIGLAAVEADDGLPVGGILGEYYRAPEVLLIGYVAVREEGRQRGIGGELVGKVAGEWCRELGAAFAVAEVHDPRWYAASGDEHAARRLEWYGRLGGRVLATRFVQPSLAPGHARVPHMLLVALHVAQRALAGGDRTSIAAPRVREFVRSYYVTAEGRLPDSSDSEYWALDATLAGAVPLFATSELDRVPAPSGA